MSLANQKELARAKHAMCPSKHSWNVATDTCKDCGIFRAEYEDFIDDTKYTMTTVTPYKIAVEIRVIEAW